jgi:hypothetical protein
MEFGEPIAREDERHQHGQWHLWLYMCHWQLWTSTDVAAGSSDPRRQIEQALNSVAWGRVTQVKVSDSTLNLTLSFGNGLYEYEPADPA